VYTDQLSISVAERIVTETLKQFQNEVTLKVHWYVQMTMAFKEEHHLPGV